MIKEREYIADDSISISMILREAFIPEARRRMRYMIKSVHVSVVVRVKETYINDQSISAEAYPCLVILSGKLLKILKISITFMPEKLSKRIF